MIKENCGYPFEKNKQIIWWRIRVRMTTNQSKFRLMMSLIVSLPSVRNDNEEKLIEERDVLKGNLFFILLILLS